MDPIHSNSPSIKNINPKVNLPTKAECEKAFWGLGDKFWMQIIDFEYHKHGHEVFDKGIHGGDVEPGFYSSLCKGCQFASEHLTEKPTVHFYKDLHKNLCSHFKGKENATAMSSDKVGAFREETRVSCSPTFVFDIFPKENEAFLLADLRGFSKLSDDKIKKTLPKFFKPIIEYSEGRKREWLCELQSKLMKESNIAPKVQAAVEKVLVLKAETNEKVKEITEYIERVTHEIGEEPYVEIVLRPSSYNQELYLYVQYSTQNQKDYERITQKLFDRYNNKIDQINASLKDCTNDNDIQSLKEKK